MNGEAKCAVGTVNDLSFMRATTNLEIMLPL
jgi:hypothetical protein